MTLTTVGGSIFTNYTMSIINSLLYIISETTDINGRFGTEMIIIYIVIVPLQKAVTDMEKDRKYDPGLVLKERLAR